MAIGLIAMGLFVRGWQYFQPRSIWMDEAFLALNIVERDFRGLMKPLDFEQGAPLGYLWGTKAATLVCGEGARGVRTMSWVMGMLALCLFLPVARQFVSASAALVALSLFAIVPPMIYYSAEVKPYSTDVAMSLSVLLAAARVHREPADWRAWLALGFVGAAAVWFSFPVVFVLAGTGMVLGWRPALTGSWRERWPVLVVGALWLLSFSAHYSISMKHLASYGGVRDWWHDYYRAYLPLPPNQVEDFKWFLDKSLGVFADPVGLPTACVALACFLVGLKSLGARSRAKVALLVAPILVVLLASAFRRYPFANRMILFLTPMLLILVAEGADYLRRSGRRVSIAAYTVLCLLVAHPVFGLVDQLKRGEAYSNPIIPATLEEIEPLMSHLSHHVHPGDEILVFHESQFAYRFYARQYGMQERPFEVLYSYMPWNDEQRVRFDRLRGQPRVWVVFSRVVGSSGHEHEPLLMTFDRLGSRVEEVHARGAAFLVLYDMHASAQLTSMPVSLRDK